MNIDTYHSNNICDTTNDRCCRCSITTSSSSPMEMMPIPELPISIKSPVSTAVTNAVKNEPSLGCGGHVPVVSSSSDSNINATEVDTVSVDAIDDFDINDAAVESTATASTIIFSIHDIEDVFHKAICQMQDNNYINARTNFVDCLDSVKLVQQQIKTTQVKVQNQCKKKAAAFPSLSIPATSSQFVCLDTCTNDRTKNETLCKWVATEVEDDVTTPRNDNDINASTNDAQQQPQIISMALRRKQPLHGMGTMTRRNSTTGTDSVNRRQRLDSIVIDDNSTGKHKETEEDISLNKNEADVDLENDNDNDDSDDLDMYTLTDDHSEISDQDDDDEQDVLLGNDYYFAVFYVPDIVEQFCNEYYYSGHQESQPKILVLLTVVLLFNIALTYHAEQTTSSYSKALHLYQSIINVVKRSSTVHSSYKSHSGSVYPLLLRILLVTCHNIAHIHRDGFYNMKLCCKFIDTANKIESNLLAIQTYHQQQLQLKHRNQAASNHPPADGTGNKSDSSIPPSSTTTSYYILLPQSDREFFAMNKYFSKLFSGSCAQAA
jgi:hypothetical protein